MLYVINYNSPENINEEKRNNGFEFQCNTKKNVNINDGLFDKTNEIIY